MVWLIYLERLFPLVVFSVTQNFLILNSFTIFGMDRWQESFSRLKHIFGLNAQGKYRDMPVYYIPGNHDIGYESLHSLKPEVFQHAIAQLLTPKVP